VLLRRINQLDDEFATAMRGELATYREWENRYTQANASGAAYVTKVSIYDKLTLVPSSFAHVDHTIRYVHGKRGIRKIIYVELMLSSGYAFVEHGTRRRR